MRLIAIVPARNEAWAMGFTVRAALIWCDAVIVLEHACTDDTTTVLDDIGKSNLIRLKETRPEWDESDYRQRLLEAGRNAGGTHFAIVDADEALTGNMVEHVRPMAESLLPGQCLRLPWLNCWRSLDQYRDDNSPFGRATPPVIFADAPSISFQSFANGYQIHTREPNGAQLITLSNRDGGGLMHFQHVSWPRVVAKQCLYRMVESLRWQKPIAEINNRYRGATDEAGLALRPVPPEWWSGYEAIRPLIKPDAEPWQLAECHRLMAEHGPERFMGLELSGVFP